MSSAMNHRKRSHRSESVKAGAFNASARQLYYRQSADYQNRSILGRLSSMFRRKAPKKAAGAAPARDQSEQ